MKNLSEIAKTIGNTPIIPIGGVFAKLESRNPAGSIKDRAAFYIIKDALERGDIRNGIVVEATSGNTGIGLAYACSALGLKFIATMPSNMSPQRIDLMKRYGGEVLLTPADEGMAGAVAKAKEIADGGAYLANQFGNASGITAHFETTAPEIFRYMPFVDYIVAGVGSGGTAMGLKKYVEENGLATKIVAVEPYESQLLGKGTAGAHSIQGIGANFLPSIVDKSKLDEIRAVKSADAIAAVKEIYALSGEKCGISSGAAYVAAKEILSENPSAAVLAIFPDGGDRYPNDLYE